MVINVELPESYGILSFIRMLSIKSFITSGLAQGHKRFSCSTQMSMKFQLFIETKIPTNKEAPCVKSLSC